MVLRGNTLNPDKKISFKLFMHTFTQTHVHYTYFR